MRQAKTDLDAVFSALADPTRRAILAQLTDGDAYVTDLAKPHDMSFAAVSRHVHVLADTGLMVLVKEGRQVRCQFEAAPLDDVSNWIDRHRELWNAKLDKLGEFLEGAE